MPSSQQAWDNLSLLEPGKFHGGFLCLFIRAWLKMVSSKEKSESKRMLKFHSHFLNFLQEWNSMKRKEPRKPKNKLK